MEDLITKKELLEKYGISYGALYRWKRKGLIPDNWFIHRSTFTGQETFLPRDKITERVNAIMQLKDSMSLDDIAASFVPSAIDKRLTGEQIIDRGICDPGVLLTYCRETGKSPPLDYHSLLALTVFSRCGSAVAAECAAKAVRNSQAAQELLIIGSNGERQAVCIPADAAGYITLPDNTECVSIHLPELISALENKLND